MIYYIERDGYDSTRMVMTNRDGYDKTVNIFFWYWTVMTGTVMTKQSTYVICGNMYSMSKDVVLCFNSGHLSL